MTIYILLLFFVLLLLIVRNSYKYQNNILQSFIFYTTLSLLFIIYVFRSPAVGTDYKMYNTLFYNSSDVLRENFIEPGYILLNSIAHNSNNFLIIPILVFIINLIGLISLNNELRINKIVFLFFFVSTYLYLSSFNIIRQYLAIGIVCIGMSLFFHFYHHNIMKYLIFILSIVLAKEFHSTAFFCIIFLILPHINITKRKVFISGLLTTFFFFTNIVRSAFISLLNFFPSYVQKYQFSDVLTSFGSKGIIQFLPVIIQFIFIYIYIFNNEHKNNYKLNFIMSGYLFFLILYAGGGNIIVDRLQAYTYIFPIFYSGIFINNNNVHSTYKLMLILFWIMYYILRLILNNSGIVPYTLI